MRRAKYIVCMFLMAHAISLAGQSRGDLRSMFVSAEGDLLFEDYAEALPKYLSLLQIFPDNYNLYYRVGQCYLNTPGEKDKSIGWLETAVKNIDPDYRPGRLSEKGAPRDAMYHLANAYRLANNFDMALETYLLFLRDADTEKYDTALVRFQMQSCHNARKMMLKPADVEEINLGAPVNERFSEFNPVLSADENTLLFTRELPFYDAIFWSTKANGNWTEPVNMTPQLGVDQDYYTSSLSPDGRTLLMYRIDTYDGNIYMSRLIGDTWSQVEKLNGHINTKFWESHATMSSDGKKIYFTSNRRESLGGLDIFVSARDSSGNWGPAANLGPEINTVYNEETPFLANNDSTLFFSSRGHFNMGGYDIFRSDLDENGRWSTPVNIGYPLNTTDDDLFFTPIGSGDRGYFSKFSGDGLGRMDIYSCDIWSERNPRNAIVKKTVTHSVMPDDLAEEIIAADTLAARPDSLHASALFQAFPDAADLISNEPYNKTDSLNVTESPVTGTGVRIEEQPADGTDRDAKSLNTEIPVRPAAENMHNPVEAVEAAAMPDKSATDIVADRSSTATAADPLEATAAADPQEAAGPADPQEASAAVDQQEATDATDPQEAAAAIAESAADTNGTAGDNPQGTNSGKGCSFWWLPVLAAMFFFLFLIWRRRKKKKENDIQ